MKAVVDQDLCVGCGMCEGTCPAECCGCRRDGRACAHTLTRSIGIVGNPGGCMTLGGDAYRR